MKEIRAHAHIQPETSSRTSESLAREGYSHGVYTHRVESAHHNQASPNPRSAQPASDHEQTKNSKHLQDKGHLPEVRITDNHRHGPNLSPPEPYIANHTDGIGLRGKTIILDPGHGGNNFGTLGDKHGTPEKAVTLQIAQKLKPILEHAGAKVIMTRSGDQDVPVTARAALSQQTNADLFLSIHCNEGKAQGALSLYEQSDAVGRRSQSLLNQSQTFAEIMVDRLSDGTGARNKGAHPGSYAHVGSVCVLHHNTVPSTLVEVGFLNGPEGQRLRDRNYQQKIADNLAVGLQQYASIQKHTRSF